MRTKLLVTVAAALAAAGAVAGQEPLFQTMTCIRVDRGKGGEFAQFVRDTSQKVAETQVAAGEIVSWTLLRNVVPSGTEARCNYMISTVGSGAPVAPYGPGGFDKALAKAGVKMTGREWAQKANSLGRLVSTEIWRIRERTGQYTKGHYLFLNYMKVHEPAEYMEFEHGVWRPMADEWIKDGSQSGWVFATKVLPSGTATSYMAYSADFYPSWGAAFKPRPGQPAFEKVHKGKNYQQTMTRLGKLRDLAERNMLIIEERVAKQ
jgi:hypothetical protein